MVMFCMNKYHTGSCFIKSLKVGHLKYKKVIRVCIIEFDVNRYRDSLYEDFSIPLFERFSTAVIKRRAEFLAGRIAAQTILKEEGVTATIGVQSDRSPQWPLGWNGSISHTDKYAIAVIVPKNEGIFLGVDIEIFNQKVFEDTADVFLTHTEKVFLESTNMHFHIAFLIAFSAKESLFKALYPSVRRYFGFHAARICKIEENVHFFKMELLETLSNELLSGSTYNGWYEIYDNNIITLVSFDKFI